MNSTKTLAKLMTFTGVILAIGCGDNTTNPPANNDARVDSTVTDTTVSDTSSDTTSTTANIRVLHASGGAPAVDVLRNNAATPVTGLAFGQQAPEQSFLAIPSGDSQFQSRAAGSSTNVLETPVLPLAAGGYYTAAAIGTVGGTGNAAFRVLALGDSIAPGAADDAGVRPLKVRLIHAAPATISTGNANGAVDVWNITGDNQAAWAPLAQNFAFGAFSGQDTASNIEDDYLSLPPATYRLGIDADRNGSPDVCFIAPLTTGGAIVNAFAVSAPGEDGGATTFSIIAQVTIPGASITTTVVRIPSAACPTISSGDAGGDAGIQDASTNG